MIRIEWDPELGEADLAQAADGGVDEGDELATAVLLSLFTDAPAAPDDEVPEGVSRGGWWGDSYPDDATDRPWGSRLWLLQLAPVSDRTPARARAYALEALAWMITDGVASAVEVTATRPQPDRIDLYPVITLTDGSKREYEVPSAV